MNNSKRPYHLIDSKDKTIWRKLYVGLWRLINNITLTIYLYTKYFILDMKRRFWYQFFPRKPISLTFSVNDICNSQCTMCFIWKQNQDDELSSGELASILQDPLYSEIITVSITGGEPTLRDDLPAIFEIVCVSLPKLGEVRLTTNAILQEQVENCIDASARVCADHGVRFGLIVSLDGVGDVHDRNRGIDGNFVAALNVLQHFRDHSAVTTLEAKCTITKENVWNIDELLEFCQKERIYIRFGLADFVNRFYNASQTRDIRNFTQDEIYQLALFLMKLELDYEKNADVVRTYRSMRKALLNESDRSIACPYQSSAVVLAECGDLQYCPAKSKVIGNGLHTSVFSLWKGNLMERRRILRDDCASCLLDYDAEITVFELKDARYSQFWRKSLSLERGLNLAEKVVN